MTRPARDRPTGGYGRLDRGVILDAALRIAARPGAADVRFRDLGDELDADPTAVYRHFRNKQHLMDALTDRLMDDIVHDIPAEGSWRTVLHSVAAALLDRFTRHPSIGLHLADDRRVGDAELTLVEHVLRALEDAGLRDETLIDHYSALSGFSLAYVASTCRELIGTARGTGAEAIPWLDDIEVTEATHPVFTRYADRLAALHFRSTYLTTIDVLVDAVARTGGR